MYYNSIYDSYYFLYNQSIGNPQKNKIIASGFTRVCKDKRKERIKLRSKSPKFHLVHSYYYITIENTAVKWDFHCPRITRLHGF